MGEMAKMNIQMSKNNLSLIYANRMAARKLVLVPIANFTLPFHFVYVKKSVICFKLQIVMASIFQFAASAGMYTSMLSSRPNFGSQWDSMSS